MRESSLVSHPHPRPSPTGRVALGKPICEFHLPLGEGQGEGKSWHDSDLTKNFAAVSGGRSVPENRRVAAPDFGRVRLPNMKGARREPRHVRIATILAIGGVLAIL